MFDDMLEETLIAPSILSVDYLNMGEELGRIENADFVHFDVMDGVFVPNLSFGPPILKAVKRATKLPVDVHLMIDKPDTRVDAYLNAGADIVTIHYESTNHAHRVIRRIRDYGAKAGIALNPATPVCMLDPLITEVDMVLLMSVDPGFGGQSFIESTIGKIKQVKELCKRYHINPWIEVDGGVDATNAGRICGAGANVLVAGSAVFGKDDPAAAVLALREAGNIGNLRRI